MTTSYKVTELFCIIDEFCKLFEAENAGKLLLADDGTKYKVSTEQNGKTMAQLMLVMGTNGSGLEFDNWKTHLNYAVTLQAALNETYPGLMRPINLRKQRFNLHLTKGSILLEVGSSGNTLQEALAAIRLFGNTLATQLGAPQ